jgi:outer membrane biosynthesis protein TonB
MRLKIRAIWMFLMCMVFFQNYAFANGISGMNTQLQADSLRETPPEFKGGQVKMYKFINKNFVYPEAAKKAKTQGKVMLKILIEKDGKIGKISVLQSLGNGCDEAAFA